MNGLDNVLEILEKELVAMSKCEDKGEKLNERIDKARTVALLACQYVSADSQLMRRQMLEQQASRRALTYVSE